MRAIQLNDIYRAKFDLGIVMNAEQIKSEIRKLSRIDKMEIYRWIDEEAAADLLSRIGIYRSHEIRQEIEKACKTTPRSSAYVSDSHDDIDHLGKQASVGRSRFTHPHNR